MENKKKEDNNKKKKEDNKKKADTAYEIAAERKRKADLECPGS